MVDQDQINDFKRKGFVLIPQLFSQDEVDEINEAMMKMHDRSESIQSEIQPSELSKLQIGDTISVTAPSKTRFTFQKSSSEGELLSTRHIAWVGCENEVLSRYGQDDRLLRIASQLLELKPDEDDTVDQIINQVHFKAPNDGVSFAWHQDSHHRGIFRGEFDDIKGNGSYIQIVVATDIVTDDNGPLKFIPGSHLQGHTGGENGLNPDEIDDSEAIAPSLQPGDAVAFGPYVVHGSSENKSSTWRRSFINGFSVANANKKVKVHQSSRSIKHILALSIIACMLAPSLGFSCPRWPLPISGSVPLPDSKQISNSMFSIGAETMDRKFSNYSQWHQYLQPLGVKHSRIQLGWARTEPSKRQYNFTWLDDIVFGMSAAGVRPWAQFSFGNPIYPDGGNEQVSSPLPNGTESLNAWQEFVSETVGRYAAIIDEWEIWNEPDLHSYIPATSYASFLILTANTIRKHQPNCRIYLQIANKATYVNTTLNYVRDNAPDLIDFIDVTYHPYSYNPDDSYDNIVPELLKVVRSYSSTMKIFQGENGAPSQGHEYGALGNYNWTQLSQAKWAMRRLIGDVGYCNELQHGGIESSLFSIVDMCYGEINSKGIIQATCDPGNSTIVGPKTAYYSYQYLTSTLGSDFKPACEVVVKQVNSTKKWSSRSFVHQKTNTTITAIWIADQTPAEYDIQHCIHDCCYDISILNTQMRVDDLMFIDIVKGNVFQIPSESIQVKGNAIRINPFPLYDSPIIIASKQIFSEL